jgi:hypothetical protein
MDPICLLTLPLSSSILGEELRWLSSYGMEMKIPCVKNIRQNYIKIIKMSRNDKSLALLFVIEPGWGLVFYH